MRSGERVSTLAFAGVTLRVRFLEVGVGEVRGVLQRVEVLVAEEFLHVPEVRAAAHEFGRATARATAANVCGVTVTGSARRSPCRRARLMSVC